MWGSSSSSRRNTVRPLVVTPPHIKRPLHKEWGPHWDEDFGEMVPVEDKVGLDEAEYDRVTSVSFEGRTCFDFDPIELLTKFPFLADLNMRETSIPIGQLQFGMLPSLQRLDLSFNSLHQVPWSQLALLVNLTQLVLNNNALTEIPPEFLSDMPQLQLLKLDFNQIAIVPDTIGDTISLLELDLSCNEISVLPSSICKLHHLHTLNLASNQLTTIPHEIMGLCSLTELSLSDNQLQSVRQLCKINSLEVLNLNSNRLDSLPLDLIRLRALRNLMMVGNPLLPFPPMLLSLSNFLTTSWISFFSDLIPDAEKHLAPAERISGRTLFHNIELFQTFVDPSTCQQPDEEQEAQNHGNVTSATTTTTTSARVSELEPPDTTFETGDGFHIKAHRDIIVKHSPYFAAMLAEERFQEATMEVIPLLGIEYVQLVEYMRYLYTRQIHLNPENAVEMLRLADELRDDRLKEEASSYVQEFVDSDNVHSLLDIAEEHQAPFLRAVCVYYMLCHYDQFGAFLKLGLHPPTPTQGEVEKVATGDSRQSASHQDEAHQQRLPSAEVCAILRRLHNDFGTGGLTSSNDKAEVSSHDDTTWTCKYCGTTGNDAFLIQCGHCNRDWQE
eukprot:TRINITY_DN6342_c0_g1_i1.p1 TRINITY_DN6342_c0_g1~~TRINITY_DN6342_c0_g1_i1.p1  ORF type:complete len:613 (-),score=105.81 TRINITY_DN6342_c0_g1_i1:20-1858(-)